MFTVIFNRSMEFIVKSISPMSKTSPQANCLVCREFIGVEMEYLFMANINLHQRHNTEGSDDFRYIGFDVQDSKSKLEAIRGRYKKNVVPK